MGSYGYYAVIALSPKLLFSTFKIAMVSAVLASLTPSCRIINMPIVEALVHA
jgi:ABC-type lipoprotein release transport system permease subunit